MTLSNSAGFAQAKPAIAQMDDFIPLKQRQEAQLVAQQLKKRADTNLASQLAANDLGVTLTPGATSKPPQRATAPRRAPVPSPVRRIPQPIQSMAVPPSVAAAQAAVAEAARVTGTESPASAGADFVQPVATPRAAPVRTAQVTRPKPPAARPVTRAATRAAAPAPRRVASANGPWRVQLGAFGVRSNADRLWSRLSGNSILAGKKKFVVPAGRVVKLQVGGYASRSSAQTACSSLKRGGQDCIVTR
jgi:cell division septation protein DedD